MFKCTPSTASRHDSWVMSRCWQVDRGAATIAGMKRTGQSHRSPATSAISYAGYRFPPDVISYAVWLYYRFPLSLTQSKSGRYAPRPSRRGKA
jgi:hypothetical protein